MRFSLLELIVAVFIVGLLMGTVVTVTGQTSGATETRTSAPAAKAHKGSDQHKDNWFWNLFHHGEKNKH